MRVDTKEMMSYVKGKRMEESDLCMLLQDMGVVLDRSTWTTLKDAYKASPNVPDTALVNSKLPQY